MAPHQITAILSSFARVETLKIQIEYLKNQTIQPSEVWLWSNPSGKEKIDFNFARREGVKIVDCEYNWSYYARNALACLATTPFIFYMDDDVFPMPRWLERCLAFYQNHRAIICAAGIMIQNGNFGPDNIWAGWNRPFAGDAAIVDVGGHSWFFEKRVAPAVFLEDHVLPHSDDIHFAYTAQKYFSASTVVLPHDTADPIGWGCDPILGEQYGNDSRASCQAGNWEEQRRTMCNVYLSRGWKLLGK